MSVTRSRARTLVRTWPFMAAIVGLWLSGCAPEGAGNVDMPAAPVGPTSPAAAQVAQDVPPPVDPPSPVGPTATRVVSPMEDMENKFNTGASEIGRALTKRDFDTLRLYMAPQIALRIGMGDWEVLTLDEAIARMESEHLSSDLPVVAAEDLNARDRLKLDSDALTALDGVTNFTVLSGLGWGPDGSEVGDVILTIDKMTGLRMIGLEIGRE